MKNLKKRREFILVCIAFTIFLGVIISYDLGILVFTKEDISYEEDSIINVYEIKYQGDSIMNLEFKVHKILDYSHKEELSDSFLLINPNASETIKISVKNEIMKKLLKPLLGFSKGVVIKMEPNLLSKIKPNFFDGKNKYFVLRGSLSSGEKTNDPNIVKRDITFYCKCENCRLGIVFRGEIRVKRN